MLIKNGHWLTVSDELQQKMASEAQRLQRRKRSRLFVDQIRRQNLADGRVRGHTSRQNYNDFHRKTSEK